MLCCSQKTCREIMNVHVKTCPGQCKFRYSEEAMSAVILRLFELIVANIKFELCLKQPEFEAIHV